MSASGGGDLEAMVWEQLKTCFDPEIPVNIVDLGLVYGMEVKDADDGTKKVEVKMTLTAQGCGMGDRDRRAPQDHEPAGSIGGRRRPGPGSAMDPADDLPEGRERLGID